MYLGDHAESVKFLIRDRGAYFTDSFDAVFETIDAHVLPTLPRVPQMNAIAERWIESCRREATNRILITGERHLRLVSMSTPSTTTNTGGTNPSDNGRRTDSPNPDHPPPPTTLASFDTIDSAASSTNTRRSHRVTPFSTPTRPHRSLGRRAPDRLTEPEPRALRIR
jgi:hypothetical protein